MCVLILEMIGASFLYFRNSDSSLHIFIERHKRKKRGGGQRERKNLNNAHNDN